MHFDPTSPLPTDVPPPPAACINQLALHASLTIMRHAAELAHWVGRKLSHDEVIDPDKVVHLCASVYGMVEYLAISATNDLLNDTLPASHLQAALRAVPSSMRQLSLSHLDPALTWSALGLMAEAGRIVTAVQGQYESGHLNHEAVSDALANIAHYHALATERGSA